jgi:hypothetical protein
MRFFACRSLRMPLSDSQRQKNAARSTNHAEAAQARLNPNGHWQLDGQFHPNGGF